MNSLIYWLIAVLYLYFFSAVMAIVYNMYLKHQGFDGISWLDCFNPIKMFSVFIGTVLSILLPLHIFEQYVHRVYEPDCSQCIKAGKCIIIDEGSGELVNNCGCSPLKRALSPIEECVGRYDKIIFSKSKYEAERKKWPVTVKVIDESIQPEEEIKN